MACRSPRSRSPVGGVVFLRLRSNLQPHHTMWSPCVAACSRRAVYLIGAGPAEACSQFQDDRSRFPRLKRSLQIPDIKGSYCFDTTNPPPPAPTQICRQHDLVHRHIHMIFRFLFFRNAPVYTTQPYMYKHCMESSGCSTIYYTMRGLQPLSGCSLCLQTMKKELPGQALDFPHHLVPYLLRVIFLPTVVHQFLRCFLWLHPPEAVLHVRVDRYFPVVHRLPAGIRVGKKSK